jgi:hypothetical protein
MMLVYRGDRVKRKIYTRSIDPELAKKIDNNGGQFTAEEHAYVTEVQFADEFKSKDTLLRSYLSASAEKLTALGFLLRYVNDNKCQNIVSLGAGQCVLEYLLKLGLPEEAKVTALDFDVFFIDKAKNFFPEITAARFDFFKDNFSKMESTIGTGFDIAVFIGAAYVMDDPDFVRLCQQLKEAGIKQIIDFHAGYMNNLDVFRTLFRDFFINIYKAAGRISPSISRSLALKIIGRVPMEGWQGKFHGYSRSRGELRRLYKKAGFISVQEFTALPYKYVAVCRY